MKNSNAFISCTHANFKVNTFYLTVNGEKLFLFTEPYRYSVHQHFRNGVRLCHALDFSRSGSDHAIMHTMRKLPMYIKYLEKEYDLPILEQTHRKNTKHHRHSKTNRRKQPFARTGYEKIGAHNTRADIIEL